MPSRPIRDYYEALSGTYDASRFGGSYGRYVDGLERAILRDWLRNVRFEDVVDLGCGTGRLLEFAEVGVDRAAGMLAEARRKHPTRELVRADIGATALADGSRKAAICFHVPMHLDEPSIEVVMREAARVVATAGRFVFDIPSKPRRAFGRRASSGWHGDTSASLDDIRRWAGPQWRLVRWRGILFLPIHRVPSILRGALRPADELVGRTFAARWSSYYVCELERLPNGAR